VERAILAGDTTSGVCVMQLDEGLDTGPVYACRETPIGADETAGELRLRLVDVGARLLVRTLADVATTVPVPQTGDPTYAGKLDVAEFELDWSGAATDLARVVRAGNPRPGAWTTADGRRLKVLRARTAPPAAAAPTTDAPGTIAADGTVTTGEGALCVLEVQPEARPPMVATAWLAGFRGRPPRLGS
jgi:methionyl-tRNA formyltransferase